MSFLISPKVDTSMIRQGQAVRFSTSSDELGVLAGVNLFGIVVEVAEDGLVLSYWDAGEGEMCEFRIPIRELYTGEIKVTVLSGD